MIKDGLYGLYKGKEYLLGKKGDTWINLLSYDENDLAKSFTKHVKVPNLYIKKVDKEELVSAFNIKTQALYKGTKFIIAAGDDKSETLTLWASSSDLKKFPELEQVAMDEFKMEVRVSDVEFVETRKPYDITQL